MTSLPSPCIYGVIILAGSHLANHFIFPVPTVDFGMESTQNLHEFHMESIPYKVMKDLALFLHGIRDRKQDAY